MNIFFTTHWPKVNLRMRITHAIYYFLMEQFYFSGLTMATAVLLIMIYYVFGWVPAKIQIPQFVWYLPLLAWRQVMQFWLQRFNIRPKLERGFLWAGRLAGWLAGWLADALRWERAGLGQPKSVS
jgi:hypothetical protein